MQAEIDSTVNAVRRPITAAPAAALPVRILGITAIGDGSGNSTIVTGRTIPWLQDEDDWNAWESWMITYRDVVILDGENRVVGVYNLTSNDLANAANFATLKQMIRDAAGE